MKRIRVAILDDHDVVVKGLANVIANTPSMDLVHEFVDSEFFLDFVENEPIDFDVLVLDYSMPIIKGDVIAKKTIKLRTKFSVVVLSSFLNPGLIDKFIHLGVKSFVLKTSTGSEIASAIRAAAAGRLFYSKEVSQMIYDSENKKDSEYPGGLTKLELKITKLVCDGLSYAAIGELTRLTDNTVKSYRKEIYKKLNVHHVSELIKFAFLNGIIDIKPDEETQLDKDKPDQLDDDDD